MIIQLQCPTNLGSNGLLGAFGQMAGMKPDAMKEMANHSLVVLLPPSLLSVPELRKIAQEVEVLDSWIRENLNPRFKGILVK